MTVATVGLAFDELQSTKAEALKLLAEIKRLRARHMIMAIDEALKKDKQ